MKSATCNLPPATSAPTPQYALRKDLGFWQLTFAGRHAIFKHEQGAYYVACLLLNPPAEPIHGMALALKTAALYGEPVAPTQVLDPATGQPLILDSDATFQQRSLGLEKAETAGALRRQQLRLEAILDDKDQWEPVKEEALRELQAIYAYQKQTNSQLQDVAQKTVHAVRTAILRFHQHLAAALDAQGQPHPVLRPFAAFLQQHLISPSGRHTIGKHHAAGPAGCLVYQPPVGVTWTT